MGNFDTQSVEISLQETLMFICIKKKSFITNLFLDILQRHCKLDILGTLGMFDHPHQISVTNILRRKNNLVILGKSGMAGHTHLK